MKRKLKGKERLHELMVALHYYADNDHYDKNAIGTRKPCVMADHGETARYALRKAGFK